MARRPVGRSNSVNFGYQRGRFFAQDDDVILKEDDSVASLDFNTLTPPDLESPSRNSRVVFSNRAMERGEMFRVEVKLREGSPSKPEPFYVRSPNRRSTFIISNPQNLAIGFIAIDPRNVLIVPKDGVVKNWKDMSDVWILSENTVYHNGEKEVRPNLSVINPQSCRIGCLVNESGFLEFYLNDKNHGKVWSKAIPQDKKLWGFIDLPQEYKVQAQFTYGNVPSSWGNDFVDNVSPSPPLTPSPEMLSAIREECNSVCSTLEKQLQGVCQQLQHQLQGVRQHLQHLEQMPSLSLNHNAHSGIQSNAADIGHSQLILINPQNLEITNDVVGEGAYSEVKVGCYQGARVAVKELRDVIISEYNRKLFEREMLIASQVRHPNLVMFVGVITTERPIIVSELMETSLRVLMTEGPLEMKHLRSVAQSVGCALVYLHTLADPIIHRDVSSSNVLLNKLERGLQVKLGDFGSANFMSKLRTVGPGCVAYSAPEAANPNQQGPKMDVYSFGVLLLEMCTGRFIGQEDLEASRNAVQTWADGSVRKFLGERAIWCTENDPVKRPTMLGIMGDVNDMD
jgi:serine/threonine protein kinase